MTPLFGWAYQFGSLVERRKVALLAAVFIAIPLASLLFLVAQPSAGRSIFSFLCHQNPERCLHLFGTMPICARCFGLYLGFGLAGLLAPAVSLRFAKRFMTVAVLVSLAGIGLASAFPLLDGNCVRLVFGLAVGSGLAWSAKSVLK